VKFAGKVLELANDLIAGQPELPEVLLGTLAE